MELYNCSAKTEDEWYIEGTANKPLGIYFLISGIILEKNMIYIPCLIVMLKKDLIRNSCYKIMLILGISDICCIFVNSVITGYLTFNGAVYCTHPNLIFISGSIGMSCWCCCCLTCVILALNRCFDLSEKRVLHYLFEGNKVCFIQAAPIVYCLFFVGFTQPVLFNSKYSAWFFDPFIGLEEHKISIYPLMEKHFHPCAQLKMLEAVCFLMNSFSEFPVYQFSSYYQQLHSCFGHDATLCLFVYYYISTLQNKQWNLLERPEGNEFYKDP
uniref:G_PROTEIN_RECEP_F1_2 domain-containing protein n=1 Tax=Heterorhabditis bacteriophora TaxID=37862 RepID=A0A1I7WSH6_HETBA